MIANCRFTTLSPVRVQPVQGHLGYGAGAFPNAEDLADHSLSLPMYTELPVNHLERVATAVRSRYGG